MKKILIIFLAVIVLYSAFVIVDCIRLRKSASDTFPLITLEENYTNLRIPMRVQLFQQYMKIQ
ncbi:MAG: hypothetical protein IKP88_08785 [Lachnospiraceae bacterium]|nr:hypothetical protein [Lachnospiraceae bacterium]